MKPTAHEITRMSLIATALCAIALASAFAGAGITAFVVLAVVVGPASFYANQLIARRTPGARQQPPVRFGRTR